MGAEIYSGVVSETIYIDPGDVIFVPEGETLSVETDDFSLTLTNPSPTGVGDITTIVAGTVHAGEDGLYASQPDEAYSVVSVVTETGYVSGRWCFSLYGGQNSVFLNLGTVNAEKGDHDTASGVYSYFDSATLVNAGTMLGYNAFRINFAEGQRATNSGEILCEYGVLTYESAGIQFRNSGEIVCETMGLWLSVTTDSRFANDGLIQAETGLAAENDSSIEFVNSGLVDCSETAILFSRDSHITIHNTGEVVAPTLIKSKYVNEESRFDLTNFGHMEGDIYGTQPYGGYDAPDAPDTVLNGGVIDGAIQFGLGDDRYTGVQGGQVTGLVDGQVGNDTLIGARLSDRFEGGADDDILRGRRGADELSGGDGVDTLNGGRDDDMLTGGSEADVFVFGFDAGTDTITDFEQGADLIRLHQQTGGYDALTISDSGADLMVVHDTGTITLQGLAGTVLSGTDFVFG